MTLTDHRPSRRRTRGARRALALGAGFALVAGAALTAAPAVALPSTVTPAANPALLQSCGLNIAINFDLSNSITSSQFTQMKAAGVDVVNALAGTPSTIALNTFASQAPAQVNRQDTAANAYVSRTSVATDSGAQALAASINGFEKPSGRDGGTNWDRALNATATSGESYDAVVFITDGAPTYYGTQPNGTGSSTDQATIDAAVTSANAVKATGAKVIAVSITDNLSSNNTDNITQISGPTAGSDYFATDFASLGSTLRDLATANCKGTVSVTKLLDQGDGSKPAAGQGWTFDATNASSTSVTTDANGSANVPVTGLLSGSRPVTLTERQQDGWRLQQQNGANATCLVNGSAVTPENTGELGFTIPVSAQDVVTCTVINERIPGDPELSISKTVDTESVSAVGDEVSYTVTATNSGETAFTAENPARLTDDLSDILDDGVLDQDSLRTTLTSGDSTPAATLTGSEITWSGALAAGDSVSVTYTVRYTGEGNRVLHNVACIPADIAADPYKTCAETTTPGPEPEPTPTPTVEPTEDPTPTPTDDPTPPVDPTEDPTPVPTVEPSEEPDPSVTPEPSTPSTPGTSGPGTTTPGQPGLASTGAQTGAIGVIGAGLLAAALLIGLARRRRGSRSE
ncbi:MAG: hypothetical protein ACTJHU_01060 [Mycetocola sp.]